MFRWLGLVLLSGLLTLGAVAEELLSISEFRDLVMVECQEQHPELKFYSEGPDAIRYVEEGREDQNGGTIFVAYTYSRYEMAPEEIHDVINSLVVGILPDEEETYADFRTRLVIQLRPQEYLDVLPEEMSDVVSKPFEADLVILLMLDSEDRLQVITPQILKDFELTEEEAFELAERNLRTRMGELRSHDIEGVEMIQSTNGLATGLPLYSDACTSETADFAIWVYDRETILRVEHIEDNVEALINLTAMAYGARQDGYGFTDYVITCFSGEWSWIRPDFSGVEIDE